MSYDFLKKALNIKSPSKTENPNPKYVPPGCEHKSSDICIIPTDWTDYITITHRISCELFSVIKNTSEFHRLKIFCKLFPFVFIVEQIITEPKQVNVIFKIPDKHYLFFNTSEEYIGFVKAIINYMPKKPEPEKPKPFSGKIVCVSGKEGVFTRGKVYTVENGVLQSDDLVEHPLALPPYKSLDDINKSSNADFIELIE